MRLYIYHKERKIRGKSQGRKNRKGRTDIYRSTYKYTHIYIYKHIQGLAAIFGKFLDPSVDVQMLSQTVPFPLFIPLCLQAYKQQKKLDQLHQG
jgi:hypothetical protein